MELLPHPFGPRMKLNRSSSNIVAWCDRKFFNVSIVIRMGPPTGFLWPITWCLWGIDVGLGARKALLPGIVPRPLAGACQNLLFGHSLSRALTPSHLHRRAVNVRHLGRTTCCV